MAKATANDDRAANLKALGWPDLSPLHHEFDRLERLLLEDARASKIDGPDGFVRALRDRAVQMLGAFVQLRTDHGASYSLSEFIKSEVRPLVAASWGHRDYLVPRSERIQRRFASRAAWRAGRPGPVDAEDVGQETLLGLVRYDPGTVENDEAYDRRATENAASKMRESDYWPKERSNVESFEERGPAGPEDARQVDFVDQVDAFFNKRFARLVPSASLRAFLCELVLKERDGTKINDLIEESRGRSELVEIFAALAPRVKIGDAPTYHQMRRLLRDLVGEALGEEAGPGPSGDEGTRGEGPIKEERDS